MHCCALEEHGCFLLVLQMALKIGFDGLAPRKALEVFG
jgi:hypothetical protein